MASNTLSYISFPHASTAFSGSSFLLIFKTFSATFDIATMAFPICPCMFLNPASLFFANLLSLSYIAPFTLTSLAQRMFLGIFCLNIFFFSCSFGTLFNTLDFTYETIVVANSGPSSSSSSSVSQLSSSGCSSISSSSELSSYSSESSTRFLLRLCICPRLFSIILSSLSNLDS